jgi:hypothetical protein
MKLSRLAVLSLVLTGCISREQNVRDAFMVAYDCAPEQVAVRVNSADNYQATGCGKSVPVVCTISNVCYVDSPKPKGKSDEGSAEGRIFYSVELEAETILSIWAWPAEGGRAELQLVTPRADDCYLEVAVNDHALDLRRRPGNGSYTVPIPSMDALSSALRVTLTGCSGEWSLNAEQLRNLRLFARAFAEQLMLAEEKAPAAKRHAPAGGWPAWQGLSHFPGALGSSEALTGPDLYEKLSPVILKVEATLTEGVSQGSAVAVAPTLALTNCHVVEGAKKIVLKQRGGEFAARLKESDPVRDRCVLEASAAAFTPVTGVRPFADLRVGETLYTLGAPSGLDLTLANGILSARREEEGVRYVQTTAPISPGSSGGGLFDAYGNLVGITTMVLIGKENHNQALNFAIAAETFWSP